MRLSLAFSSIVLLTTLTIWIWSYRSQNAIGWRTVNTKGEVSDYYFRGLCWWDGDLTIALNNHLQLVGRRRYLESREGTHFSAISRELDHRMMWMHYAMNITGKGFVRSWNRFIVDFTRITADSTIIDTADIRVPIWFIAMCAAALPSVAIFKLTRMRRRSRGNICPCCGYDLTGNVSGVCAECGRALLQSQEKELHGDIARCETGR